MIRPTLLQWFRNVFLGSGQRPAEAAARPLSPARPAPVPVPVPAAPVDEDESHVPQSAHTRVATIHRMLDELQARIAAKGGLAQEGIELEQIKTLHLPRLLKSYVEIPPQHRAEIFRSTGRSASVMLTERLDRIIERLTEISRLLAQGDLDTFASNIRFIDTRYGAPGATNEWE